MSTHPAPALRVNGAAASSERFYALACDPRRNVVVEACAGAGKTWMLVSRLLRALLDGAEPGQILAITFTRKAAGEMRQRLDEWLAEFAAPSASPARRVDALRERGLDARDAEALAAPLAALHERVLASGRGVPILTFHAWFAQLLQGAPMDLHFELGLQPGMELIEETAELEPELFARFHRALLADDAAHADFRSLVVDHGRWKVRKWLLAAWDKRIEIGLAERAGTLRDSVPEPRGDGARALVAPEWRRALAELAQALGTGGAPAQEAARGLVDALGATDPRQAFDRAWAALYTKEGAPRKQLGRAPALPEVRERLEQLALEVREHDARRDHLRMVPLARLLLAEYAALKRERGLADMADLERAALALLRDTQLSAWVQQRLDTRVRHVLIDEFQDTSPLQWQALQAWLAAYAGSGGGAAPSVFIVGDPKQSIYRFRRAEPRVFAAARDFVVEGLGGALLECDHTRRNRPEVLAAVNAVFGADPSYAGFRVHTSAVDAAGVASVFALPRIERARERGEAGPPVLAWRDSLSVPRREPEEVLREREAEQVALALRQLVAVEQVEPGEIMVLCRRREPLVLLAQALRALHVPFAAAEDTRLADAPTARDLIALLDALVSPRHDLSLAHALRSPIFGASDDDLVRLAERARDAGSAWCDALVSLPDSLASPALLRARTLLATWRRAARQLPPHDLLDRIVAEGDVEARVAAAVSPERRASAAAAIDALLAQSLAVAQGRGATVYAFVRALRRRLARVAAPAERHAVQLLTVHGAKGLESRVVIVMDSDPERRNNDTATLLIDWPVHDAAPRRVAFIAAESRVPPSLQASMDAEFAAREREEHNALYVAMTRAKQRLVFSATEPYLRAPAATWWERVAACAEPWTPSCDASQSAAEAPLALAVLPDWTPPEVPATARAASPAARLGSAVHRVLQWCAGRAAPEYVLHCATRAASEFGVEQPHEVARIASAMLNGAVADRFLHDPALRWAGNEVDIAVAGSLRRIDRLVQLADGTWWVLDYKLDAAPQREPAYLEQLRAYRDAVAAAEPGANVRCGFVTGSGELVEISAGG